MQATPNELVVTHEFTIGWLIRHALGVSRWRWWGLSHCHAGLTVIRYFPDRPPTLIVVNDVSHLPSDLRWTGFPADITLRDLCVPDAAFTHMPR